MSDAPFSLPSLLPYLIVQDADKSLAFYKKAFGFRVLDERDSHVKDEAGKTTHVEMAYHDIVVMMAPEWAWGNTQKSPATQGLEMPLTLYMRCPDVDALYVQAMGNGAISISQPQDAFWGDRVCTLEDRDGYRWAFATRLSEED